MTKRILEEGSTTFHARCTECGTHFSYELEDVGHNYMLGGDWVSCPKCHRGCRHYGQMRWDGQKQFWRASCQ